MTQKQDNEKSTVLNLFTSILGIISGFATVLLIVSLFFSGGKIKVDIVETYHGYFGNSFDFANFVPRIIMMAIILTCAFILIKTQEPITMIIYTSIVLGTITFIGQKIKDFQFTEGQILGTDYFSIRRVITLDEKKQWLNEKISAYSPGSDFEPSRQWLMNNSSDIKYSSIDELVFKLQKKIADFAVEQKSLEILKLKSKNVSQNQKGVTDYIENFAGWVMDHPKTVFFIVVICVGVYYYKRISLEDQVKDLFQRQNTMNDEQNLFNLETKDAINKLDENHISAKEQTTSYLSAIWKKLEEIMSRQNTLSTANENTKEVIKKVSNELVGNVEKLQSQIKSVQQTFTDEIAKNTASQMNTNNIFQKVDDFAVVANNLESKLNIMQSQVAALDLNYAKMGADISADILKRVPELCNNPVLNEQMKIQIDLCAQQWCSRNISKIVEGLTQANLNSINERINNLSASVQALCNHIEAAEAANQIQNILIS